MKSSAHVWFNTGGAMIEADLLRRDVRVDSWRTDPTPHFQPFILAANASSPDRD
jgi:hypothetical protein